MALRAGSIVAGLTCLAYVFLVAGPAEGFNFGRRELLEGWESYEPTVVELEQTQSSGIHINKFPFTTPPASDCVTRALWLVPGCQPFLNIINANGDQLSKYTVHQILELAKDNKTADEVCYNKAVHFLNGGCICDNGLISTINLLKTVPRYAKEALTKLNKCKCPATSPPPPAGPVKGGVPPPITITTARMAPPTLPPPKPKPAAVEVAVEVPAPASEGAAPTPVAAPEAAALAPSPMAAAPAAAPAAALTASSVAGR